MYGLFLSDDVLINVRWWLVSEAGCASSDRNGT